MAITIFLGLCMLGEGFLVYVLFHFIQEARRGQASRRPSPFYRYSPAASAGSRAARGKVIEITDPERDEGRIQAGQRARATR